MRVALVLFSSRIFGGANKFASELAAGLKNSGFDVAVCAWDKPVQGRSHEELLQIHDWFTPTIRWNIGKLYKITFNLGATVRKCVKKMKPEVVINTTTEPSVFHSTPDTAKKVHFVHYPTELTAYLHSLKYELYRSFYWWIHYKTIPKLDAIVCNSNYIRQLTYVIWQCVQPNEKRYHTIYPCIDTKKFEKNLERQRKVCYVGRIDDKKGIDMVLQAFLKIKKEKSDVKFDIKGGVKGSIWAENYLPKLIAKLKEIDSPSISLKTDVSGREIADTLLTSRCMASFNPEEHYGIVPVEAMAAGTPPIVANGGGQRETIINGETGFLVNSLDEMIEKMRLLLTDDTVFNRISKHARERAKEFDRREFVKKWINLIEEL